ncbi:DUF4199 domain-containing protein [Ulvibacter antarcticus]|uniref:Uncharacterized protein DUF4199 n=1 Tax=Ulvibacter antarcticus TaxID=442714 RepID=A0A3L9YIH3_9FLAO|nr:DUF4199 domain-containing protein [Ulvibacter antarcticus]RMA57945.1 uncharacterized protein DUF4199 [Ulvibacter antarcticus]
MKKINIELKWAILFTIMFLAWMLLEKTLGWHDEKIADHSWLTLFFIPFAVLLSVLTIREKRRRYYKGSITWLQAFKAGVLMSLFVAILSPIAQYITHNYITPEYFVNVKNHSITNQLMTIEAANEAFNINSYFWQAAIGAFIGGVITSAIVAFFAQRKRPKKAKNKID